jgi:hypothetical protein
MLALSRRAIGEPRLCREFGRGLPEIAPAQGVDAIAREDDPLSLAPCEALLDQVINPALHRLADLGAESAVAERRVFRKEPTVAPGAAICASIGRSDLVASDSRHRQAPSS